jgi:transposase
MILAERAARVEAGAFAARVHAVNSSTQALIAHLKLEIEKLRRELYGARSERKARLREQMGLRLEGPEASASEDKQRQRRETSDRSSASDRRVGPSRIICRASASSSTRRRIARVADRQNCRSWARTSPGRWR